MNARLRLAHRPDRDHRTTPPLLRSGPFVLVAVHSLRLPGADRIGCLASSIRGQSQSLGHFIATRQTRPDARVG
jgi:hypothetical protein